MEAASASPNFPAFLQTQRPPSQPLDAFFLPASSPSFLGSRSMMSFEDAHQAKGPNRPFFQSFDQEDNIEDELDDYFHQPEKKRRLTIDQVKFLEKSFEVENKLEPERKIQLAKDLGLQPRQIAIWFQNRRARWKTKQLEKDYNALQSSYNTLKADYETLLKDTDKLKSEVNLLSEKMLNKEKGNPGLCDKDTTKPQEQTEKVISDSGSKDSVVACKQEDLSSGKSDIFDSESLYTDGVHSSLLEAGESSYVFEQDQSDLSQDEDDNLTKNLLPAYVFPKLEDVDYSASFEDQNFWTWSY